MAPKTYRSGPLPAQLYSDLVTFHRSGRVPLALGWGPTGEGRFRLLADKVKLSGNTLICLNNYNREIVPKEQFESVVMAVHTRNGLDGPGHRGVLSTTIQVRLQYSIGESNFGIPEAEVRRIVLRCPDPNCTHQLWKNKLTTGHWSATKPIIFKSGQKPSCQQDVVDLTSESQQLQPLDLSLKRPPSNLQHCSMINTTKPLNFSLSSLIPACSISQGFSTAGAVASKSRPTKRDLSEDPLKDIQDSWSSAIRLMNSAPLLLNTQAHTAGTVSQQKGADITGNPVSALATQQKTVKPPPCKRQKKAVIVGMKGSDRVSKVTTTSICWPPTFPYSEKKLTNITQKHLLVPVRQKASTGNNLYIKLGSVAPLSGIYSLKSASSVASIGCPITSAAPSNRVKSKFRRLAAKGTPVLSGSLPSTSSSTASSIPQIAPTPKDVVPDKSPSSVTVELVTTASPNKPSKKWVHTFPQPESTPEKHKADSHLAPHDTTNTPSPNPPANSPSKAWSTCSSPINVVDVIPIDEPTAAQACPSEGMTPHVKDVENSDSLSSLATSLRGSPEPTSKFSHKDLPAEADHQPETPARSEPLTPEDEPIVIDSSSSSGSCPQSPSLTKSREFVDLYDVMTYEKLCKTKQDNQATQAKQRGGISAPRPATAVSVTQVDTHSDQDRSSMLLHLLQGANGNSRAEVCYAQFCLVDLLNVIRSMKEDIPRVIIQDEDSIKELESKIQKGLKMIADAKNIIAAQN